MAISTAADGQSAGIRLAHLAYHDALTGLPNRARLVQRLEAALALVDGRGAIVLLSIDLDDFKLVNDGLGHAAGDELLRQIAARLDAIRRREDLLARVGGDEFVLLAQLRGVTDAATATIEIARRISAALEAPFRILDAELRIGASVGAALYPDDALDAESLHCRADAALYEAKKTGSGFASYRPGASDPLARLSMAAALRSGLEQGALFLHYQPIFRLPTRELIGLEALVRWDDDDRGVIAPDEFIPIAEKTGVIHALGEWVLREACRDARQWDALGLHPNIGINISPRQLQRHRFAATLAQTVAAHGIDSRRIVLELTESAWTLEGARLEQLTGGGFPLALDDFGAGCSTLSRLRTLPVDVIKVDRSFMTDLPDDPQAAAVVEAILALANACGCDVVAEGVETEGQLDFLARRDCSLVQGFHLGRPQSVRAITELMRARLVASRRS